MAQKLIDKSLSKSFELRKDQEKILPIIVEKRGTIFGSQKEDSEGSPNNEIQRHHLGAQQEVKIILEELKIQVEEVMEDKSSVSVNDNDVPNQRRVERPKS